MKCSQFKDPLNALGTAVNLLRNVEPYKGFDFGSFSNVLMGQIQRKHYLFAIEDATPVGYAGWGLTTREKAEAWQAGTYTPKSEDCRAGDSAMLLTFYAENTNVVRTLIRQCRSAYPNTRIYGIRNYQGRERQFQVFNRVAEEEFAGSEELLG